MSTLQGDQSGYIVLALAIILGAAAVAGSWKSYEHAEEEERLPQRVVTLSKALGECSTHEFRTGLKVIGCDEDVRGEKRGDAIFMKPPARY
ncbi:hypothetical protein [Aliiruegeria lutimaris]|uniref:Uncharacterized protein n=1 Tax=Aliiruegeria lutimaris TaxID=571298 RepID=A0A1G8P1R6_9RHOB|nr:hypothetical protein [Aliiruegeria lutimaris]SDI86417.1 hypothetical protein SAMN04488026_100847 [Aliiruegeria lutimaris]